MSSAETAPVSMIESYIYLIRGQKVLLDADLATLYQVETKALNQAVRRNVERFPEDFMFQLTRKEDEAFEVTDCNLKRRWPRRTALPSPRFYGAGNCHALVRPHQQASHRGEHRYYADLCPAPAVARHE